MEQKYERDWAMGAHLMTFLGFVFPFGNIVGPLIIYLAKREESEFVEDQAREAVNFQITVTIALIIAFILAFVVIGMFMIPIIVIGNIVFVILAALAAQKGQRFRYPFCLRLLK